MLSVEVHEGAEAFLERGGRDELVVEERAAAALGRNLAPDDDLTAVGRLEDRLDRGRGLAGADEVGRRAAADEQTNRLDDDRLAGARLAREDVEAGLELDLERLDDGQMPNAQKPDHRDGA